MSSTDNDHSVAEAATLQILCPDPAAAAGVREFFAALDISVTVQEAADPWQSPADPSVERLWLRGVPAHWPAYALQRLRRAAASNAAAVTALGAGCALPRPLTAELSPAQVDSLCYLLGEDRLLDVDPAQPPALLYLPPHSDAEGRRILLCERLHIEIPGQPAPAVTLPLTANLSARWPTSLHDFEPIHPGLSAQPVVLHVLHDWGGGIARFVADLAAADPQRCHLALRARGSWSSRRYGIDLELSLINGGLVLGSWPLSPAIGSICEHHPGYRDLFAQCVARFGVSSVLISSLIGHSLDALDSGRPTAVVAHDYFPLWPELHCNFGDPSRRFDADERAATVASMASDGLFGERDPAFWQSIHGAYVRRLAQPELQMAAPSQSVISNLARLAPELAEKPIALIPHGLRPWPQPVPEICAGPDSEKLRLLVPGRIDGGKGLELLRGALPELTRHAELHPLGCGKAGEELFGVGGVHIELDYQHRDFPTRVARIRPHAALLLSTVAESFSYTLSEVWSLGVVPLATRTGAFAERIADAQTGLLFTPDARALISLVRGLANDRGALAEIRQRLATQQIRSDQSMATDYRRWQQAQSARATYDHAQPQANDYLQLQLLAARDQLRSQNKTLEVKTAEQQQELVRRAEWGFNLDRQLRERTEWARRLQQDIADLKAEIESRERSSAERVNELEFRLRQLQGELEQSTEARRKLRSRARERLREERRLVRTLTVELADLADQIKQLLADRLAKEKAYRADLAALEAERDGLGLVIEELQLAKRELLTSTSWRITAPLRGVVLSARRLVPGLNFRMARARALLGRVRGSLARRGLRGTIARASQELRRLPPPTAAISPPVADEQAEFTPFAVPYSVQPRVSVVIPVYGKLAYTVTCLQSLAACGDGVAMEIIVVDDCSPDDSAERLQQVDGLRLIRNEQNLGFIGACNAGAKAARGEFVCFLNNDTAVRPGWLDALVETFDRRADCGLAGSKLIYPDGRLQEAGGIVFADGDGWNYGRFEQPNDPRFDYEREVDYCSGAAILIRAALFAQFGGFDQLYQPAYYEDTDLAFKVRDAGLKVIYQPRSEVVHFEGISSGTDTSSGIKRFQPINRKKFLKRWADALAKQPPHEGDQVRLHCEHRVAGRILIVDATTPTPDQDSGSVRMMNLLRLLVDEGWKVVFFADNRAYVEGYSEAVRDLGVEVQYHPWLSDPVEFFKRRGADFDAVMVCRHYVATHYAELVRQYCPKARFLFDTVDLHYLREERAAKVEDDPALAKQAKATRKQELGLISAADITLVVSPTEQTLLASEAPQARVEILSNIHSVPGRRQEFEQRDGILFVGGFQHTPNVDAVQWFVDAVWPRVHHALPQARFHIVGSRMPKSIEELGQRPGVIARGFVEELTPLLDGCRIAVAPLRYGAGVKGKVNSSMAHGQPVVMTQIAAEGMHLENGKHGLISDDPVEFADAVIQLYSDPELWLQISDGGIANVTENFSLESAKAALRKILYQ